MIGENGLKLSIVVVTYFHGPYIQQALDSIFSQNVDFSYEVLVGDDASGDETPQIIQEYARQHPDVLKPVLRQKNLGATRNASELFNQAKGEYIAMLDGDDYWINPNKLQIQVDFLDQHPEYIGCAHKCVIVDENGTPDYTAVPNWTKPKKVFTLNDFLKDEDTPGQVGTQVFRNILPDYSPMCAVHPIVGDRTLSLMLLAKGDFYCFNSVMSAYRSVIKKDAKNWFSIHHNNPNWQYDAFMRPVRLQAYARSLGIHAVIGPKRDYHYTSLVEDTLVNPNPTRLKHISTMTALSRKPLHCLGLIGKHLILR